MVRKTAALVAVLALAGGSTLLTTGCGSKAPPTSGVGALQLKDPVWATYAWSRNRMNYVIFFTPNPGVPFKPEGVAAKGTYSEGKEGDVFEGGLDGLTEKSKSPFRVEARKGELKIEGKLFRVGNGSVFLVHGGSPSKIQQLQIPLPNFPKDPEEWPTFAEAEVQRILKENPKIKAFPQEPPPDKAPAKKKP
jgi:hypothetical protein